MEEIKQATFLGLDSDKLGSWARSMIAAFMIFVGGKIIGYGEHIIAKLDEIATIQREDAIRIDYIKQQVEVNTKTIQEHGFAITELRTKLALKR